MLNTYSTGPQTLATDDLVVFDTNGVSRGCCTQHTAGTSAITLAQPGYYQVYFNGIAYAPSLDSSTNYVALRLRNNGIEVPAAQAATTIIDADVRNSYSFSTLIKVLPSCLAVDNTAVLTVVNAGAESTVTNANLTVVKL